MFTQMCFSISGSVQWLKHTVIPFTADGELIHFRDWAMVCAKRLRGFWGNETVKNSWGRKCLYISSPKDYFATSHCVWIKHATMSLEALKNCKGKKRRKASRRKKTSVDRLAWDLHHFFSFLLISWYMFPLSDLSFSFIFMFTKILCNPIWSSG